MCSFNGILAVLILGLSVVIASPIPEGNAPNSIAARQAAGSQSLIDTDASAFEQLVDGLLGPRSNDGATFAARQVTGSQNAPDALTDGLTRLVNGILPRGKVAARQDTGSQAAPEPVDVQDVHVL